MFLNYDPESDDHPNFISEDLEEVNNLEGFLNKLSISNIRTKIGKDRWVIVVPYQKKLNLHHLNPL